MDLSNLTDQELLRLKTLLHDREIYNRREALKDYYTDKNPNYTYLAESYAKQKYVKGVDETGQEIDVLIDGKRGVVLEGSSRSGKTYSSVDFIIYLCLNEPKPVTVNILKETYQEFKTTLYDDFRERLNYYELPNPFYKQEVHSFRINGSKINLIGADKTGKDGKFHGASCDFLYINESLAVAQSVFDQSEMRCRKFWFMDYNPSVTEHYIFNKVLSRPDVGFLRTTFKDNPYVSIAERLKILSYEPWLPGSYEIIDNIIYYLDKEVDEKHRPPPHPSNVDHGTADEFMWKVYGLGLRGAMKGLIFKHITWINNFPDIAFVWGMDLGFTVDPLALVKFAKQGKNIYLEYNCYKPIDNPEEIDAYMTAIGVSKETPITADSADKYTGEGKGTVEMVRSLANMGWNIKKVRKRKNIMYWLSLMKEYKIHVIRNNFYPQAKKEFENYRLMEVNGISINQPIDGFDHGISAGRYALMSYDFDNMTANWD